MTRSAPRYATPSYRARRAARDPFLVRLGVLLLVGVIVAPIAALIARSDGGEVVRGGSLPGAAVAVEPAPETTTAPVLAPIAPAPAPAAGTIPATIPSDGTLPATIAPPTTVPAPTTAATDDARAAAAAAGSGSGSATAPAATPGSAPKAPATTAAPKPTAPPTTQPAPPPTTAASRIFGSEEVQAVIRAVFPDDIEDKALLIAYRESRFDPAARNFCCTGLFQIYGDVHVKLINGLGFSLDQLTDPFVNSVVAYALYQRSGWAPWGG